MSNEMLHKLVFSLMRNYWKPVIWIVWVFLARNSVYCKRVHDSLDLNDCFKPQPLLKHPPPPPHTPSNILQSQISWASQQIKTCRKRLTLMNVSPIILLFSSGSVVTFRVFVTCFLTGDWSFLPDITVVLL